MHRRALAFLSLLLLSFSHYPQAAAGGETEALPNSLSRWYKPQSERQVWLHTMFSLRRELQAVQEYAEAGDAAHLAKWAGRLTEHYRKLAEMVPEWADELELGQADALEQAARSGDTAGAGQAAERLGRSCRSCHREYRALAAARYRAPDFSSVSANHGGVSMSYPDAMEALSKAVNRIKIATDDGRWVQASEALGDLNARLENLGQSCDRCHQDAVPRERILGSGSREILDDLTQALAARDRRQTGRQLGNAAVQICARCHGVHRTLSDLRRFLFE